MSTLKILAAALLLPPAMTLGQDGGRTQNYLSLEQGTDFRVARPQTPLSVVLAADAPGGREAQTQPALEAPPLPVHTIEGYGGGSITPTAYLVNPGPKGEMFGLPAASFTYAYIGHGKNLETLAITETLWQRIELGYGLSRFGLGDIRDDIEDATGVDVGDDIYMHNFNVRFLLLEENSFRTRWVPALTFGGHYKYNQDIDEINDDLGRAFESIGLDHHEGVDLTLTASKMFAKTLFDRPLIVSAGLRNSDAAWLGYLGFGDERHTTFEGHLIYMPFDWMTVSYEFRQKTDPFEEIPGLKGDEDPLHAFGVIFMPSKHLDIAIVYGLFGNVVNEDENSVIAVQVKWEF